MSTKIYKAWRCSTTVFSKQFLPCYRKHCINAISKQVKDLMLTIKDERLEEIAKEKRFEFLNLSVEELIAKKGDVFRLRELFKKADLASKFHFNDIYCLDCSINVWFYNGKAYIIPYGLPNGQYTNNFELFKGLEDYSYWNIADEPEGMDYKEWTRRGKTWDKVCLDDWNYGRMVHEIVSLKDSIGLFNICNTIVSENDFYGYVMDYKYDI